MAEKTAKAEIARRDPFEEMQHMMDDWTPWRWGRIWPARAWGGLLDDPFAFRGDWMPAMDVIEEEKASVVRMELPGIEPKEVEVRIEGGFLVVEGNRERETVEGTGEVRRRERRWGRFCRSVGLPADVDPDRITAEFEKGILTVRIPKPAAKAAATRKIEIKKAA